MILDLQGVEKRATLIGNATAINRSTVIVTVIQDDRNLPMHLRYVADFFLQRLVQMLFYVDIVPYIVDKGLYTETNNSYIIM